jgi:hypothetical protein
VADQFVTVATYSLPYEAELAKNLLETEGIESFLTGGLTADTLFGNAGLADQVRLQVREDDAQRAAGLLAVHAASVDADWEERAEHDPDVWVCSLCGAPVSNQLTTCHGCQTPRASIRADRPLAPAAPPPDAVQKRDEIAPAVGRAPVPAGRGAGPPASPAEDEEPFPEVSVGDDMARRALIAAVFGVVGAGASFFLVGLVILLPLSWYFLARVMFYKGELSPGALRRYYLALAVSGGSTVLWLGLFALLRHYY